MNYEKVWDDKQIAEVSDVVHTNGFGILRGFLAADTLQSLWRDVDGLTMAFCRGLGIKRHNSPERERDRALAHIVHTRPDVRSGLYDRLQQLPSLLSLPDNPTVRALGERLLTTTNLGVWPRIQMRLDMHDDEVNLIRWHHDYIYNKGTTHSYTFWIPLVDVSPQMGPITLALRSHEKEQTRFEKTGKQNRFDLTVAEDDLAGYEIVTPAQYRAGDLVVMHSLLLHTGNVNKVPARARLTVLFRLQDLNRLELFEVAKEAA